MPTAAMSETAMSETAMSETAMPKAGPGEPSTIEAASTEAAAEPADKPAIKETKRIIVHIRVAVGVTVSIPIGIAICVAVPVSARGVPCSIPCSIGTHYIAARRHALHVAGLVGGGGPRRSGTRCGGRTPGSAAWSSRRARLRGTRVTRVRDGMLLANRIILLECRLVLAWSRHHHDRGARWRRDHTTTQR
jgi:hypothetical protein